jgi:LDH2 family malate/lactate/ureidoglycolate dehydrogenase
MSTTTPAGELLDQDTPDTIRLSVTEAAALGGRALHHLGFADDEVRIIIDQLLDNALCGYPFASLPRILAIARDAKTCQPRQAVRVVHETPVSALIDGGNHVGYVAVYRAAQLAIDKARGHHFAVVGAYNSYYSGQVSELIARLKATPRQPGVAEIRIPSERAFRERERRRVEGLVFDRAVITALHTLATP